MQTISFPRAWKARFGFAGAAILSYLEGREDDTWFHVPAADIQEDLLLHPSGINAARERLRADGVIDVRKAGSRYEFKINHERLDEIANETEGAQ